jgi:capsular polysaccharide transport system permease protein
MKTILKLLFTAIFFTVGYYIINVETERYESVTIVLLKDLSKKQSMDLGSILGQTSSTMQDSKILELYMRSNEMYEYLDEKYQLSNYYTSDKLDFVQRLYADTSTPFYIASKENLLKAYNKDLFVVFDEPSGTLSISFSHIDKKVAKEILKSIIHHSDEVINHFSKENAQVALHFIEKQIGENKALFISSIKKLIQYQNKHHTIDPNLDVTRKINILAILESDLIKAEVEYNSKSKTYNLNDAEMKMLKETVLNLKKSIKRVEAQLAGSSDGTINANVFDFSLLKSTMEFNREIYRQTLINQEQIKIEVNQNAKHIIIVSKPTLADNYTYPDKPWDIFTLLVILLFLYSVIATIISIIEDHKD